MFISRHYFSCFCFPLQGLDLQQHYNGYGTVVRRDNKNVSMVDKSQYRCSLINIEQSQDDELDAILGELSELETQFSKEIVHQEERKRSSDESSTSNTYSILSRDTTGSGGSHVEGGVGHSVVSRDVSHTSSSRNNSPDT